MIYLKRRESAYATPTLVSSAGSGTGGAMTPASTANGDFVLHLASATTLVVPTEPSGFTALGAGISCDETGSDISIIVSGKFISAGESVGAAGSGRAVCAAFRNVDPEFLNDLTGDYAYDNTPDGSLVIAPLTLTRQAQVVALGARIGLTATPYTDLTLIKVQNEANGEARIHWTNGPVASFAGYSYSMSATTARATCAVALYGAPE